MNLPNNPPLEVKTGLNENSTNDPLRKSRKLNKYFRVFNTFRCINTSASSSGARFRSISKSGIYDDSEEDYDKGVTIIKKEKSGRKYSILKLYE